MKMKKLTPDFIITLCIMATTAILITVSAVVFKQSAWRTLPLYVSLFIALLQSRVNRFAPLIGSVNSLVYALVYFSYNLYASALYAVLVSCPLQMVTFLRWRKHKRGTTTRFRSLTGKQRLMIFGSAILAFILLYLIMSALGSGYLLLDNTVTLVGIFSTVFMMLAYIEYTVLVIVGNLCSISLYITMLAAHPEQLTYLIFSCYSLFCGCIAVYHVRLNYKAQQTESI